MEVVAAPSGNGTPFHNHDVREWSRLDSLTGVLERARLETDHWTANTVNSSHKYNKVVDSRARSGVDGNVQQQARRKLEVFQSQVPGGRLQVIKTQTVSSSRWTSAPSRSPAAIEDNFEDLKLSLNPLDLSTEKSKASVGRTVGRRPPSRSRIRDGQLHAAATTNLHRVSRLCHQVHGDAVKQAFGHTERLEDHHRGLSRTKSTSSEDVQQDVKKSLVDLEDLEQLQNWRRTSKLRRSLQYPKQNGDNKKPPDLPENTGSVKKIREDLETGRRLSTALRGNNLDLNALDQILKSISSSSVSSAFSEQEKEAKRSQKRDSFVTVESIKAVRDRLRRTSSPEQERQLGEEIDDGIVTETPKMSETHVKSYIYGMEKGKSISGTGSLESRSKPSNLSTVKNEDWFSRRKSYGFEQMHSQQETISSRNKRVESSTDSGICRSSEVVVVPTPTKSHVECTSESEDEREVSTVKKYAKIFENNATWNKKSKEALGTTISIPITSNHEWSETKRSEKKHFDYPKENYVKNIKNSLNTSTAYGENNRARNYENNKVIRRNLESKHVNEEENGEIKRHSIAVDETKYIDQTRNNNQFKRISLSITDQDNSLRSHQQYDSFGKYQPGELNAECENELNNNKCKYQASKFAADLRNTKQDYRRCAGNYNSKFRAESYRSPFKSDAENRFLGNGIEETQKFDENRYEVAENHARVRTEDEDESNHRRQSKKVEFCKTEVHFAADSGRVNIVETDEKPPPTQNFRRRRRNSNLIEDFNRNGLPVLHFGDTSYEKMLFSDADAEKLENLSETETTDPAPCVTVNANALTYPQEYEENHKDAAESEIPKGILKNKPVKPKPYILGDNTLEEHENAWGVKLRTGKEETPVWRSTVTLKNTLYENADAEDTTAPPEFQQLLKQLRPTVKKPEDETARNSDTDIGSIRILSPTVDTRRSSWSVADRIKQVEDLKWCESKGYSTKVNFGEGEATVVENRHPTWPRREEYSKVDDDFKYPECSAAAAAFKSPSLIMNTFRTESTAPAPARMPQQLEALRRLYDEEVQSDSEADKEVHRILMSVQQPDDGSSSVVSGSWSKMRAFKHISHYQKVKNGSHAHLEKETNNKFQFIDAQIESDLKHLKIDEENLRDAKPQYSPMSVKKSNSLAAKSAFSQELSSPYLVRPRNSPHNSDAEKIDVLKRTSVFETGNKVLSQRKQGFDGYGKQLGLRKEAGEGLVEVSEEVLGGRKVVVEESRSRGRCVDRTAAKDAINRNKSPIKEKVVRQPKKSEMAYFGVKVSPKTAKKEQPGYSEKPDLVQCSSIKKLKDSPPIYENVKPAFDSSILEELTKAADEILQAVNGYTDEEHHSKYTSEEEAKRREPLDTISETKSWKQRATTRTATTTKTTTTTAKAKLKQTSSNSSIDSVSRECRRLSGGSGELRKGLMTRSAEQKQRKKALNGESAKARRLQRASSREALLQSHGSSSEDLAANTVEVIRKPRLVKKTKTTQLTISNGIELKKSVKKKEDIKSKHEERVPVISLPEIRHKTAVSTIRSTAEKAASRERSKLKIDDGTSKKKTTARKEITKGASSSTLKQERPRGTVTREYNHRHTSVTTQKKPTRTTESTGKH